MCQKLFVTTKGNLDSFVRCTRGCVGRVERNLSMADFLLTLQKLHCKVHGFPFQSLKSTRRRENSMCQLIQDNVVTFCISSSVLFLSFLS